MGGKLPPVAGKLGKNTVAGLRVNVAIIVVIQVTTTITIIMTILTIYKASQSTVV